ncbi:zinc-binding metallopeptidase family protein [Nocardia jejuensis]|uniref:zinc-binding metallopeptidase family protein n=1 Tax=Nocardia jejuensis TaxID=328049 RepID=UPI00083446E9|nr:putative zinc-binding metallopeptidase [Nocardia jejuensis]
MRDFTCSECGQRLVFENTLCLSCGSSLGFSLSDRNLLVLPKDPESGQRLRKCANQFVAQCNWMIPEDGPALCESCRLTRTRPADNDDKWLAAFGEAESAKRRLILELTELGLPLVGRDADPEFGLAFDLLSSAAEHVVTGHENGVITLDLAEGDVVHREQVRVELDEAYRTLLGHFRHEIGHYYFPVLVTAEDDLARFRDLFGDPYEDYQEALNRHYSEGKPPGWESAHVSAYATMHPAEDWAETFAHYLHIRDTLDTAAAFGFAPAGATLDRPQPGNAGFDRIIELWLPLAWALNMMNRSMGHRELYPFVLADRVLEKMRFIHELCATAQG